MPEIIWIKDSTGASVAIAADQIANLNGVVSADGAFAQRVKPGWGPDGEFHDITTSNPMPVAAADVVSAISELSGQPAGAPTTQASVSTDNVGVDVLASNSAATYRLIENVGSSDVTLKLGTGTVTDNAGIVLKAGGGSWDGLIGNRFWTGAVRGKCASGTSILAVVEG